MTAEGEENDTKPGIPVALVETWEFTFCVMLRDGTISSLFSASSF